MVRERVEKKNTRSVSKDNDLWKSLPSKTIKLEKTTSGRNCAENKSNKPQAERPRKALHSMQTTVLSELLSMQEMSGASTTRERTGINIAKELSDRMIVYIMGPYSASPEFYTSHAMKVANIVLDKNGVPFIPHLTHFWDKQSSKPWMFWIAYDLYLVDNFKEKNLCAVHIPGPSNGADIEERFFIEKGVKVYQLRDIMNPNFNFPRRKAYGR